MLFLVGESLVISGSHLECPRMLIASGVCVSVGIYQMKLLLTAPGISGLIGVLVFDAVTTDQFPVHVIRTKTLQHTY